MKFTIYQESRIGRRRNNQDRIAHCYSRDALLTVLADGMGGHLHGEIAAQIAVQYLTEAFQREAKPRLDDPFRFLASGLENAHYAIVGYTDERNLPDAPRTTCVVCVIQDNIAYWAHCGDSRLYLMRDGRTIGQTRDHSRVRLLIDQGVITEAQAASHPERNKVYSCLGGHQAPEIEFSRKTPLEAGDVILLSTDGFWGSLPPDMIALSLKQANLMQAVPMLMNQAEARGGQYCDNLSVVAVRWEDSYVEAPQSSVSTQTMALDEVTTKLDEFGRNPAYKMDLSEDEIEKAIQEICSTIDKYSPPKK